MVGAVNQAGAVIEEGIWRPVQGYAAVRATVAVKVNLAQTAQAEQLDAFYTEGATLAFDKALGSTKEVHGNDDS